MLHGAASMNIEKKILADPINRWIFSEAKEIYLVGGFVRDLLRGVKPKDRDFVVRGDARALARKAAKKYNGTCIELYRRQAYRVASKNRVFIDFSVLQKDITDDLGERDFTVNAIAWSPEGGLIAPQGHLEDLNQGLIRTVNPINLLNDPLRVIRAYRFSAQLGFDIEQNTRGYLKRYAHDLENTSSERITEEFIHILNSKLSHKYILLAAKDKVFYEVLPMTCARFGINIQYLMKFDILLKRSNIINNRRPSAYLNSEISQGLTRSGLVRLSLLLNEGKRPKSVRKDKRFGRLRLSTKTKKALSNLTGTVRPVCRRPDEKILFNAFYRARDAVYESAIVNSLVMKWNMKNVIERAGWFLKIKDRDLLRGDEIASILHVAPGREIALIKAQLKEQQFYGTIRKKADARDWILSNLT